MLFIIGILFLIFAICYIIYNKSPSKNVFEALLESGDKYVDNVIVGKKSIDNLFQSKKGKWSKNKDGSLCSQSKDKKDIPVVIGDQYDKELACPTSLGKGGMKNEKRCRTILEKIFKKDFPTVRPNWLKNPATKRNLEIDCYNHELKIGLEYSPDSSHTTIGSFHKTKESLIYQMRKDMWKAKRCKELGITLITVPSWATSDLKGYITRMLTNAGKLPKDFDMAVLK